MRVLIDARDFQVKRYQKHFQRVWVVVTGPVGKHFGDLESYPVHNQIHGIVPIELYALVNYQMCPASFPTILKQTCSSENNARHL